jgi:hypothetical protein
MFFVVVGVSVFQDCHTNVTIQIQYLCYIHDYYSLHGALDKFGCPHHLYFSYAQHLKVSYNQFIIFFPTFQRGIQN